MVFEIVLDEKIDLLILGLWKTILNHSLESSEPFELILLPKMICSRNQSCSLFCRLFYIHNRKLYNIFFSINLDLSLYPVNHSTTQAKKRLLQRNFFLRFRLCFDIPTRIALRGIGAERCVKWKSMGLELMLIDGLEKMLFYLHSLLCCSWMKAQQSSNGLLRLFRSRSPTPTTTYESHFKTTQKSPSSCNNKSESFTNCYIEVGGSGS